MIETLTNPAFLVVYALIQAMVFLLLIRFLDLYEREPLPVVALMAMWGATGAVALSLVGNRIVLGVLPPIAGEVFGPAISGPLVEEVAKGLALAAVFFISYLVARRFGFMELEGVTDGVVYAAAVGVGFAFTEDLIYLLNAAAKGDLDEGLSEFLSRVDFLRVGQLGHAVYTGVFGAGLGLATWSRGWAGRLGFPLLGLALAMLMHAVHNGLTSFVLVARYGLEYTSSAQSGGIGLPEGLYEQIQATNKAANAATGVAEYVFTALFFTAVVAWLYYQRRVIREELAEEVDLGLLSSQEWEIMPCYLRRTKKYLELLWAGKLERLRLLKRIHGDLVDLAFLKWRASRRGGEGWDQVDRRRRRISYLRSLEVVE